MLGLVHPKNILRKYRYFCWIVIHAKSTLYLGQPLIYFSTGQNTFKGREKRLCSQASRSKPYQSFLWAGFAWIYPSRCCPDFCLIWMFSHLETPKMPQFIYIHYHQRNRYKVVFFVTVLKNTKERNTQSLGQFTAFQNCWRFREMLVHEFNMWFIGFPLKKNNSFIRHYM